MHKRKFLQALLVSGSVLLVAKHPSRYGKFLPGNRFATPLSRSTPPLELEPEAAEKLIEPLSYLDDTELFPLVEKDLSTGFKHAERTAEIVEHMNDEDIDGYLNKIRNFDADFLSDIYLSENNRVLLSSTLARLERVQNFVGHGNFNLLGYDEMLYFARNYPEIGQFEEMEKQLMEEIFSADASRYGFFGDKIVTSLTNSYSRNNVVKIADSGHYLLKGESLNLYKQLHADVGEDLLLTSGIRNIVKQLYLFLAKTEQSNGNLSKASRSLAPPGYSYHGVGDFDVGKIGLGEQNFTSHFSTTNEFRRMITLGYVDIRYTDTNRFGVRYEPWHIKIT